MLYLVIILCGMITISAFNARYTDTGLLYCLFAPIILTLLVVLIDGLFAWLIRKMPEKYFTENHKIFDASKKESKFCELMGVKFWKDYVLELGGFTDFHKNKVSNPNSPLYLKRFILECNYGSCIHLVTALTGYLIIFLTPLNMWYQFAFPVAFVNMVLNLIPMAILRYNVPRLKRALKFASRRQ